MFEVERELSRVREEIERMQGRKRLMVDVTSLTTIDIRIQEIETYEPAAKTAFDDRVDTAWTLAVSQATETGQNLTVKPDPKHVQYCFRGSRFNCRMAGLPNLFPKACSCRDNDDNILTFELKRRAQRRQAVETLRTKLLNSDLCVLASLRPCVKFLAHIPAALPPDSEH